MSVCLDLVYDSERGRTICDANFSNKALRVFKTFKICLHELCVTVAAAAPTSAFCVDKWAKSVSQTMTNFPRQYLCLGSPATHPISSQSL